MKAIIRATAPTSYQLNSLRAFNLNVKQNGNGSHTGTMTFNDEDEAKAYLRARAEKYNDEDPNGTEERLAEMLNDINKGCLTLDAVTAHIENQTVQEMTKAEFIEAFKQAEDGDLVAENIAKKWSSEEGGYWFVANAGECDGGDTIAYWFESEADEKGYVESINARI